ncbi:phage major capsid protein [Novosphingobium sp. FSY-8]|uniref:Phage major capsid protein n=1 Tax=Novosphingobium ovatum TaxID=1908523 RepID=A0ABW9XGU3_9SPHN|nr:phage major capsid protein [Novosphingobium ovatum]NBC37688.1 phage major capsid protein [Novosphingobium ovatum]
MEIENHEDALNASFDIVARQDATETTVNTLRSEIAEVKSRMDRAARHAGRPMLGGNAAPNIEMKGFVDGYLRAGRETELKSMTISSAADGGFAVPSELDRRIAEKLVAHSPIRAIAQVVQTGTADYRKLISLGGTVSGWVSESSARPGTSSPQFAEIIPPAGELYANPSASQQMLDDAAFDLEAWLADEIAREFARAEGAAFITGTGSNQPMGFLGAPVSTAADASRTFGTLQYIASDNATGFGTTPDMQLIDMVMALKAGHRQGAVWVMNSKTLSTVRKLKDADGAFLWQNSLIEGQPDRLLGYPVIEAAEMPDVAAGAYPIAFGNFNAGYIITERMGTRILRDPYSNKPFVNFYATRRVGGQVLDSDAIKLLKIAAA